jgi:hypothetical protein
MTTLDIDDADGLEDLADRSRRAAKTARRTASADAPVRAMLLDIAERAEGLADAAEAAARWIQENR